MRWLLLVLVATSGTAHADGDRFVMVGLGSAVATREPGWALRIEHRLDATRSDTDEDQPIAGGRIGLETWGTGNHWGFSMPLGMYAGGQVKTMRTTLGGGVGLWAFERNLGQTHFGVAPFVSASLEKSIGKMAISIDGRLARQVVSETDDFNVYTVMLMVGRRRER